MFNSEVQVPRSVCIRGRSLPFGHEPFTEFFSRSETARVVTLGARFASFFCPQYVDEHLFGGVPVYRDGGTAVPRARRMDARPRRSQLWAQPRIWGRTMHRVPLTPALSHRTEASCSERGGFAGRPLGQ
jgi:hypothetical protein